VKTSHPQPADPGPKAGESPSGRHLMPTPEELLLLDGVARRFTQERARRTFEALVAAAGEVFIENGYDATGTPDIAERAGVSVGTFYRYFDDKKQVYLEVARRHLVVAYHQVMDQLTPERFAGGGHRETLAAAIDALVSQILQHPGRSKVFLEMTLRDPDVAALRRAFDEAAQQRLASLLAAVCSREAVPDPQATAFVLFTTAVECANGIAGLRGEPATEPGRAKRALTAFIDRALFGLE
jgi:AcrR family transcriptional regulator